jgi:hypothetical protein
MRPRGARGAVVATVLAAACGGSTPTEPTAAAETLQLRIQTPHFRMLAGTTPEGTVRAAADRLEQEYDRIAAGLNAAALPVMTVRIWQDETTYFDELMRFFGVRYQAAGYVTGPAELRVLAVPQLATNAVHEFVHAATLSLNPSFGNNPRWFWETVALYENGERVDPRSLDYLARGAFPTLQQLNADPNAGRQIYEVGYLLGEFIVTRWGRPAFLELIRTNANLPSVLGVSASEFEAAWQAFVRQRYF